ncbi:MAG TPA: YegS/Rv2252/BmrU family lipid kinase [Oscillospiraceae bacterium]|nr:YegS/Rv2252/BmrU family lipid kinase [Oscillospiraceae bacterium]HXK78308.1 YegS/Rv2252/BmrU family lipid kinase [Oscillospiraceae bacterium]
MSKKLMLILNPCAGLRAANRYLADMIGLFCAKDFITTVFVTGKRGDATQWVEEYGAQYDVIACIGGDGTFNETLHGILESGIPAPIGYIPAGSTNDFANSFGLSLDVMEAAKEIAEGTPRPFDAGKFGSRHFSYVASFGAFTHASYSTPQAVKNFLGHLAYILEGTRDLPYMKPEYIKLDADGTVFEGEYLFGAVSNSTSLGGILTIDPTIVDMNDGKFEIMLIRPPETAADLAEIVRALTNRQYDCNMIDFASAGRIAILSNPDGGWSLDGEFEPGQDGLTIENLHSAVNLLCK